VDVVSCLECHRCRRLVERNADRIASRRERFVGEQHRHFRRGAHLGDDQPVALACGVSGLANLSLNRPPSGSQGQAMALRVELPPMVAAADAIVLDLAIIERGAAVAAAGGREADAVASVAKQDQVLARCANSSGMSMASDARPTGANSGGATCPIGLPRTTEVSSVRVLAGFIA